MFGGRGMIRLAGSCVTLAVLLMLIYRARQPESWFWLTGDDGSATAERAQLADNLVSDDAAVAPEPSVEKTDIAAKPAAAPPVNIAKAPVVPPSGPVTPGPTDLDPDQQAAAIEEFQAITDRTISMQAEEMPSYWRVFSWVKHQSFAELQKRSREELKRRGRTEVTFNDLVQRPRDERGRLVTLDLNVRRVLPYDVKEKNSAGVKRVYEIWGWTTESKAWLYVAVVPYIPPGMPIGSDVHEKARLTGYFYKLQGYHEAGAAPKDKPIAAPLLIGRVAWQQSASLAAVKDANRASDSWLYWIGGVLATFIVGRMVLMFLSRKKEIKDQPRPRIVRQTTSPEDVQSWLANAGNPSDDTFEHDDDELPPDANESSRRPKKWHDLN